MGEREGAAGQAVGPPVVTGWGLLLAERREGDGSAVLSERPALPAHPIVRRMDRFSRLVGAASLRALDDAGLGTSGALPFGAERAGVAVGTDLGALDETWAFLERLRDKGPALANPMAFPNLVPNAAAGYVAILTGWTGPSATFTHGETSAEEALSWAAAQLRAGRADPVLVAGGDERGSVRDGLRRALKSPVDRPAGEGAAAVVLESSGSAASRSARVAGRLLAVETGRGRADGFTATGDARAAGRILARALQTAGVTAGDVAAFVTSEPEAGGPAGPWESAWHGFSPGRAPRRIDPAKRHGHFPASGVARAVVALMAAAEAGAPVVQGVAGRGGSLAVVAWGPP